MSHIETSHCQPSNCTACSFDKNINHIGVAIGAIVLLGGVFILLAAYRILPYAANPISNFGEWGVVAGYGGIAVGFLGTTYSIWQLLQSEDESVGFSDHSPISNEWKSQIQQAQVHDTKAAINSWQRGHNEQEQTFGIFDACEAKKTNALRTTLTMVTLDDNFSEDEHTIYALVCAYLQIFHGLKGEFDAKLLCDMDKRQSNYGSQYSVAYNLGVLKECCSENKFVLGFTSQDIYAPQSNFIFGIGLAQRLS